MKIKKLTSFIFALVLSIQCVPLHGFAADSPEMEAVYSLSQNGNGGYGYLDYSFVDESGNSVEIEGGNKPGSNGFGALNSTDTDLPTKYSLKDLGLVTNAKNQGDAQSCWAFTALGAMESNRLVNGENASDFSEAHLVWFAQNSLSADIGDGITRANAYGIGGNWMLATAALSRWSGTVNEADYPFYPYEFSKMGNYSESERYNTSGGAILNSAEQLTSLPDIKSWIMKNGAVEANIYFDYSFFNMNNNSYCCNDSSLGVNHAILIVGWDDYYSKSNFNSSSKPAYPGAFLCKNSWGEDWGDNGYFWVSYFDATLCGLMGYTCIDADTYDNNYTYNGFAYGAAYKNTSVNGSQIANVFTSKGYETLSAISTYTMQSDTYAEVFIYKNLPANYSKPNQGTLVYSSNECLLRNAGYHTISIDEPVALNPDEIFSVVIRLSNDSNLLYVVGEYNNGGSVYTSKSRQSYIDISGTNSNWTDSLNYGFNNNCIQAFTVCNHQPNEVTVSSTCETDGTITVYCSQCGEQLSIETIVSSGHSFGEWEITKTATKTSEGEKERTCEICNHTEKQSINRLPQTAGRTVTLDEFMEILKRWFDNFIARIIERNMK